MVYDLLDVEVAWRFAATANKRPRFWLSMLFQGLTPFRLKSAQLVLESDQAQISGNPKRIYTEGRYS